MTALKVDIELGEYFLDWEVVNKSQIEKLAIEYHFEGSRHNQAQAIHAQLITSGKFEVIREPDFSHAHQNIGIYRR